MLWCALVLPDLALQVFTRGRSEAAPLAILGPRPQLRVVAADSTAMACGVEPGMGRASALALAPGLHLRERAPALERAALIDIATWAGRFTSSISLDPPDTLLLEVQPSLRLFGGLTPLCTRIGDTLGELGFVGQLAVAPTPLAARWLARCAPGSQIDTHAGLASALDPLPLAVLADGAEPATPASLDLLTGIGARVLADVRRLPRSGLARRHARAVTAQLDRAYARIPDPRPWFVPPERYVARLPLPAPTDQVDTLLFGVRRLLAGLSGWLDARQAGLERFTLVLEYERHYQGHEGYEEPHEIVLGALSQDMARCQLLAREHLTRNPLPAPVDALRLEADNPNPLTPPRTDLFDGDDGQQGDPGLLLATLRARLGHDAVRCLAPHPDHRPERAWRWIDPSPTSNAAPTGPLDLPSSPRPLWLLATPRPIARPAAESLLTGPERIEAGWWDGPAATINRDYFVARSHDDCLVWIFQERQPPHGWFIHGYFN
ncbi:MAG: DNA polymerase Y family protein [Zoogloea sp.]|uniref:Y-family DNA polymerase n=1 Tax=Zoogloea sp. TaxID=49181 RepID=UPI002635DDE8|nr:DNA polymerase Y family protein [Zoogloea sp.]MDD2989763.1 DNA polymerase Y family protein [Zoogloea sp.]